MERFHVIEDAAAILHSRGVYRQTKVYHRAQGIYAGHGSGFVRLYRGGATSVPIVSWSDLELGSDSAYDGKQTLNADAYGRLLLPGAIKTIGYAGAQFDPDGLDV